MFVRLGKYASKMAASNTRFAHDWVDEKILNFLQFLQVPLRHAAKECACEQLETMANQLQLASGAFVLSSGEEKLVQKLALFRQAQQVQALLVGPDESEGVERLSPEKLQAGFAPKMQDVHAEHLKPICEALAHVLLNMDYGKLARYLTFFGDQAFHTALHMELDKDFADQMNRQLVDRDGSQALAVDAAAATVPSSI